jgi:hypothetical protein
MRKNCGRTQRQQRILTKQVQKVDANHFSNLITSPQLLDVVESNMPEYRERHYPLTVCLAMFLGQVLNADGSSQKVVYEALVNRLLSHLPTGSANTSGYCRARQRLPEGRVRGLVRQTQSGLAVKLQYQSMLLLIQPLK